MLTTCLNFWKASWTHREIRVGNAVLAPVTMGRRIGVGRGRRLTTCLIFWNVWTPRQIHIVTIFVMEWKYRFGPEVIWGELEMWTSWLHFCQGGWPHSVICVV